MEQRDILLIPFPFSDQSGRKVRPVIVISNNEFNEHSEDIIVVGVTSNIVKEKYTIPLTNKEIEEGGLITKCCVKAGNILKIDKELVIKKIGKIKKDILKKIVDNIIKILKD